MDANELLTIIVPLFFFAFGIYCQILIKRNEKELDKSRKNEN